MGMGQQLAGKRVLVTGANDGMGRAIAERFVAEGARVAVHGRNESRLAETLERIRAAGGDASPVSAELRDMGAVRSMCRAAP